MVPIVTVVSAVLFWIGAYVCYPWRPSAQRSAAGCRKTFRSEQASGFSCSSISRRRGRCARRGWSRIRRSAGRTTPRSPRSTDCCRSGVDIPIVWLAYENMPEVREILRSLSDVWDSMLT
jgi:hypothetical protein